MLLAIDTCGKTGTAALGKVSGSKIEIFGQTELPAKRNSSDLIPQIRALLTDCGLSLPELTALVVVSGPGSFTGIRIGLGTTKGLAEALDKPVIAVSRLAVLARKAGAPAAALDAGRGEFYFGEYPANVPAQEALLTKDQIQERAAELTGLLAVCEEAVHAAFPSARLVNDPTASDALHFALPRLVSYDFDDQALLDANYLRRPDAELFAKPAGGREGSRA